MTTQSPQYQPPVWPQWVQAASNLISWTYTLETPVASFNEGFASGFDFMTGANVSPANYSGFDFTAPGPYPAQHPGQTPTDVYVIAVPTVTGFDNTRVFYSPDGGQTPGRYNAVGSWPVYVLCFNPADVTAAQS